MKLTVSLIALMLSLGAFAQERVLLNSKRVSVSSADAILVRTAQTPKKVKVNFVVPMGDTVCQAWSTRYVPRQSRAYCGFHIEQRRVRGEPVCTRRNPANRECTHWEPTYRNVPFEVANICPVPEQYCSQYGRATSYEEDSVTLKFKHLPNLGGTEQETFLVHARQKRTDSSNVVYTVTPQETVGGEYVAKDRGFLGLDKFVIQPK